MYLLAVLGPPLILSPCIYRRPLTKSLAKTLHQTSLWICGDSKVDRVVIKRQFTASHAHFWWPRRKDEEDTERSVLQARDDLQEDNEAPSKYRPKYAQVPRKIHILGAGNLGAFVAHALAGIPNRPPVTLLLLRRHLRKWEDHGQSIDVSSRGVTEKRLGFEVEIVQNLREDVPGPGETSLEVDQRLPTKSEPTESASAPERFLEPHSSQSRDEDDDDVVNGLSVENSNPAADSSLSSDPEVDALPPQETQPKLIVPFEEGGVRLEEGNDFNAWFAQEENGHGEPRSQGLHQLNDEDIFGYDRDEEIIYNLVVSVKAPRTVKAIEAVAHRLTSESTILFLQNGMGTIDEVNEKLFPNEERRPTYIIGVVSHGLYSNGSFCVKHAGEGTIALGVMPRRATQGTLESDSMDRLASSARYLLRTITRTPVFVAVGFPPTDLLQQQLDKLVINCIINPLTAILDCKNGALLSNFHFTRVIRLLLAEISLVIKSLPELNNVPNVNMRFDTARLERLVFSIANTTGANYSSMLQDVRVGRQTEIDYINGYIIKRGEEMGIHCVMNYMLLHMIKGKRKTLSGEQQDLLPFMGGGTRR